MAARLAPTSQYDMATQSASGMRFHTCDAAARRRAPLPRTAAAAIPILLLVLALYGCGRDAGAPAASSAPPPAIAVTVLEMVPKRVPIVFNTVGQIEGARQVEVRARVSGILQRRLYNEGAAVAAGAPLFQIDRAPFEIALAQARAQLEQDNAKAEQARREQARLQPLAADRAISRKEYDDAVSTAQLAAAALQASAAKVREAELNLSYTLVTAPVAGITGRAEHSEGTLITTDAAGSLLTTINQVNPVWVRFSLAQSDLARIPAGKLSRSGPIDLQLILADGSRYPGHGRLNFAATAIDLKLGTQQLRAEFDNPEQRLLPGEFVRLQITAGTRDDVFLVPQPAVMQTEKAFLVFVVDAQNKAELRPVQMGEWVGSDWTVLSGLKAGDRVIVDNLLKVRPGAVVTPNAPAPAGDKPTAPSR
jgi:membrane fusion protein (multidrug efflux system)